MTTAKNWQHRLTKHFYHSDNAFIPLQCMREIKWEESVVQSQANRAGHLGTVPFQHISCHCGAIDCLGQPADPRRFGPSTIQRESPSCVGITFPAHYCELDRTARAKIRKFFNVWKKNGKNKEVRIFPVITPEELENSKSLASTRVDVVSLLLYRFGLPVHNLKKQYSFHVSNSHDNFRSGVKIYFIDPFDPDLRSDL